MSTGFVKFPSTPHLLWLGEAPVRKDKVMTTAEAEAFLKQPVTVEEKVDGANIGISFDANGHLMVQNRGSFVERGIKNQFAPLWRWLSRREEDLFDVLEDSLILFGEWCYARHSIHYTHLPDLFLAFDILDKRERRFMSSARRDEIASTLNISTVPKIAQGIFTLDTVGSLASKSTLYDGPMEGIYLRQEDKCWLTQRAKIVRSQFVQQIGQHWSKQFLVANRLRSAKNESPA